MFSESKYSRIHMCDHLSSATTYPKHQILPLKALWYEPLVNDHLLQASSTTFCPYSIMVFYCF